MTKINLVVVCVDNYYLDYARKLITKMQQVSNLDITPYCITDHRLELAAKFSSSIFQSNLVPGWWNKIQVFNIPEADGWTLYMDLDIVIQQNFDDEILHVISQDKKDSITCVSDALGWMGNKFSSSWMMFYGNRQAHIYNKFTEEFVRNPDVVHFRGGDQVWIGENIKPSVEYIDEVFPNLKKNLKFDLSHKKTDQIPVLFTEFHGDHVKVGRPDGNWEVPAKIDQKIKLVDCGGNPKPHELQMVPYIRSNWFDV